jgi:hypothetical protein
MNKSVNIHIGGFVMRGIKIRSLMTYILVLSMICLSGCILDPKEDPKPPDDSKPKYGDLTKKEHVIDNLVQSYKDRNINRYEELLLDPGYLWYPQDRDVKPGDDKFWSRDQDIRTVGRMFNAAMGQPDEGYPEIERLDLRIEDGTWYQVENIGEEPCPGCWMTERIYHIEAVIGETTYIGDDDVMFYITPFEKGGKTIYQIKRADDLQK